MHSNEPSRRKLLGAVTGSIVLAGCLGDDGDDGEGNSPGDGNGEGSDPNEENGTESPTDEADDETDAETDSDTENGSDEREGNDGTDADQNGTDSDENPGDDDEEPETGAVVQVTNTDEYGEILVGPDGYTLYMFDPDERGAGSSTCYDDCADNWPPLTVESDPTAGADVGANLSTFERENGARQVTANGWPLYYWANDESPGDTTGQGVNDVWWVLDPGGNPIRASGEDTPSEDDETENDDGDGDGDGGDENGGDDSENGDDNGGGYGGGYD